MNSPETFKKMQGLIKELPLGQKIRANAILFHYQQLIKLWEEQRTAEKVVEKEFLVKDVPLAVKQSQLIKGERGPNQEQLKDVADYLTEDQLKTYKQNIKAKRLNKFWLTALKNNIEASMEIKPLDEPLLQKLYDIDIVDEAGTDNFTVRFHFEENQYMNNLVLTKRFQIEKDDPISCQGCQIQWKQGKNLQLKEVKKKQKNKKTGASRTVTKTVEAQSFFNMFNSKTKAEDNQTLNQQFAYFGSIVDQVVPYSLQYFFNIKDEQGLDMQDSGEDEDSCCDQSHEKQTKKKGNANESKNKQCKQQ